MDSGLALTRARNDGSRVARRGGKCQANAAALIVSCPGRDAVQRVYAHLRRAMVPLRKAGTYDQTRYDQTRGPRISSATLRVAQHPGHEHGARHGRLADRERGNHALLPRLA
jgi:hypothetical protein